MPVTQRVALTTGFFTAFFVVYFGIAALPRAQIVPPLTLSLDAWVPFVPAAVWIYVLALPAIATPLLWLPSGAPFERTVRAYALVSGCAFLCFLAWPASGADWRATVALPDNPSATELVLAWVYALDPARNVCPSLHVGLMTVATCAARRYAAAPVRWIYVLGLAAISFAVLAIRQHVVMDSLLGLMLGAGVSRWQLPAH